MFVEAGRLQVPLSSKLGELLDHLFHRQTD